MESPEVILDELLANDASVRLLARHLLASRVDAEDVAQDAWVAALRNPPRERRAVSTWLSRVVRRLARSRRQSEDRRRRTEELTAELDFAEARRVEAARHEVATAVFALDEPYRTAVYLRYFENLPPRKIAERLDVSVAAVEGRLRRGLEKLRARLDRDFGDRRSWCTALIPIAGSPLTVANAAGTSAAANTATIGGLVMGLKSKLALGAGALLVLAGAAGLSVLAMNPEDAASPPLPVVVKDDALDDSDTVRPSQPAEETASRRKVPLPPIAPPKPPRRTDSALRGTARPGFVTGRIVAAESSLPIHDARVWLERITGRGDDTAPECRSAPSGRFRLPVDFARPYSSRLRVDAPDRAPRRVLLPIEKLLRTVRGPMDLGDLEIPRGARVHGRVFAEDRTRPVSGALIRWTDEWNFLGDLLPLTGFGTTRTAEDGTFEVPRIAPNGQRKHVLFAVTDTGIAWGTLGVAEGQREIFGVELIMQPTATVDVRVEDERGEPVVGARVIAWPRFAPLSDDRFEGTICWSYRHDALDKLFTGCSDPEGRAKFSHLPVRTTDDSSYRLVAMASHVVEAGRADVRLLPSDAKEAVIRYRRETPCVVTGRVTDYHDRPIRGAVVQCGPEQKKVETDANGAFRVEGLDARWRRLQLYVQAKGFAHALRTVTILEGGEIPEVRVRLRKSAPIAGRIADQFGSPIAGARLALSPLVPKDPRRPRDEDSITPFIEAQESDRNGRFAFPDAVEGDWRLSVRGLEPVDEWAPVGERHVRGGDRAVAIRVIRIPPGRARLTATVVRHDTGDPLPIAAARLRHLGQALSGDTIAPPRVRRGLGRVTADRLRPGRWRLEVEVQGLGTGRKEFTVAEHQADVRLRLDVGAAGAISGRVILGERPTGKAARRRIMISTRPHRTGRWVTPDGRPVKAIGCTMLDPNGHREFRLVDLPGGSPVRLLAHWPGEYIGELDVTVPFGGEKRVELRLVRTGAIRFRSAVPLPRFSGEIELIRKPDGPRRVLQAYRRTNRPWVQTVRAYAGQNRWRIKLYTGIDPNTGRPKWFERSGEARVAAGEETDVTIR